MEQPLPHGFVEYLRKSCAESLRNTADQFKRGNPEGVNIAREIFHSARWFWNDEDTSLLYTLAISISDEWLTEQFAKKDGKRFLADLGELFTKIAGDYESQAKDKINADVRQFVALMDARIRTSIKNQIE